MTDPRRKNPLTRALWRRTRTRWWVMLAVGYVAVVVVWLLVDVGFDSLIESGIERSGGPKRALSILYPVVGFIGGSPFATFLILRAIGARRQRCPRCWYPRAPPGHLPATRTTCPECGLEVRRADDFDAFPGAEERLRQGADIHDRPSAPRHP